MSRFSCVFLSSHSYRKPSRARRGAGCAFDPLWPALGTPAGKPRSTSLHRPPLLHLLGRQTSGGRGAEKRGSEGEGSQRRIPRGGHRPIQELLGVTQIPSPPAALATTLPSRKRQTRILRMQSRPLPPSLPHPHSLSSPCHPAAPSSRYPPCMRRGRARSRMSPSRLHLRGQKLKPLSDPPPIQTRSSLRAGKPAARAFPKVFLLLQESHFSIQNLRCLLATCELHMNKDVHLSPSGMFCSFTVQKPVYQNTFDQTCQQFIAR